MRARRKDPYEIDLDGYTREETNKPLACNPGHYLDTTHGAGTLATAAGTCKDVCTSDPACTVFTIQVEGLMCHFYKQCGETASAADSANIYHKKQPDSPKAALECLDVVDLCLN